MQKYFALAGLASNEGLILGNVQLFHLLYWYFVVPTNVKHCLSFVLGQHMCTTPFFYCEAHYNEDAG